MKLLPGTPERIERMFRGNAETVPILAQINEHVVKLFGGNVHLAIAPIRHFGRLPFADRPLESFSTPEFESFESFKKRYGKEIRR